MFHTDFCKDPLTGIPNLFGLLEFDISEMCGESGSILAFDIVKMMEINERFGRNTGDLYIKTLGARALEAAKNFESGSSQPAIFRTGGDEFTLILPEIPESQAQILGQRVESDFELRMQAHGINSAKVRMRIIPYKQPIKDIASVVKWVHMALCAPGICGEITTVESDWTDSFVRSMIYRLRENLSLLRKTDTLALTDEISKLPNHRAAKIYLGDMLDECRLDGRAFSLLFIDGDNLKRYNELGYQKGNEMIKGLGDIISQSLRHSDRVFRWLSGDEFMVVLAAADREVALLVAERIRRNVEIETMKWAFPVTVSIGVSSYPEDSMAIDELVLYAERANAQAKQTGKNQVVAL